MKVYLDNCVYNRPFDDQKQIKVALETRAKRHIQRLIKEKKLDLIYSYINRFENEDNPNTINRNTINDFFKNAILYIDHTHAANVGIRAAAIIRESVKTKDALHVSSAIEGGCNYFISTDKTLLRYKTPHIILCSPIEFLDHLEEEYE
jgi:predicted nucleic acid-binding protein